MLFRRKVLGLPDHVKLLPESEEDKSLSKSVTFGHTKSRFPNRREIMKSSIFDKRSQSLHSKSSRSKRVR